ncbi:MAG: YqeG family HAD IIIA-type phosphatase [Clostridia bacterium]|nr:YqeG family HAD IIIA-type phosphatase [Clostridia bacterium]
MLKPHFIINTITDITVDFLRENKIEALLLDVDNTLSVAHKNKTLRSGVKEWLERIQKSGIKLIVLSNAKAKRAKAFAKSIGLDAVGLAAKPLPFGYLKAVKNLNESKRTTAVVGDQIFTDVFGGRLAGIKTILVTDITPEQTLSFKIRRKIEQKLRKRWGNGR